MVIKSKQKKKKFTFTNTVYNFSSQFRIINDSQVSQKSNRWGINYAITRHHYKYRAMFEQFDMTYCVYKMLSLL